MQYRFTINTDASYHSKTKIAAWAYWIKSDHYLIKGSGLFDQEVSNSSVGELLAMEKAIERITRLVEEEPFLQYYRDKGTIILHFNSDSLFSIYMITGLTRRSKHLQHGKRIRSLLEPYTVVAKHVKAHTDKTDKRSWVNRWCDQQAIALVRKGVAKLNG